MFRSVIGGDRECSATLVPISLATLSIGASTAAIAPLFAIFLVPADRALL